MRKSNSFSFSLLLACAGLLSFPGVSPAQSPATAPASGSSQVLGITPINPKAESDQIIKLAESGDVGAALEKYQRLMARSKEPEFAVLQLETERRLAQVFTHLASQTDRNTPRENYNLGLLYAQGGFGTAPNLRDAIALYRKAADAGDPKAMSTLGFILVFQQGNLVRQLQGYNYIKRAAELGDPVAMLNLGVILQDGLDVVGIDLDKAMEWYTKAADAGNTQAMLNIADLYDQGVFRGPEPEKATAWYQRAAKAGDTEGMIALANRMRLSFGAQPNPQETLALYQKAIDGHSGRAVYCLGMSYAYGWVTPIDFPRAIKLLETAGKMGYAPGYVELGHLYTKGLGVAVSQTKAFEYFQLAASARDPQGMFYLGLSYINGWGTGKEVTTGFDWVKRSAEAGEVPAMVTLAKMYYDGRGTPANNIQAVSWMRKAATLGNLEAKQILQTWNQKS